MRETTAPAKGHETGPPRRRRRRAALVSGGFLALGAVAALSVVSGLALDAPDWLISRVEAKVNAELAGQGHVRIGGINLELGFGAAPRLGLREVRFFAPGLEGRRWWGAVQDGVAPPQPLLHLSSLDATLNAAAMFARRIQPETLHLDGGTVTLRRLDDGRFDLALGGNFGATGTLDEVLDAIDAALSGPLTSAVAQVDADGLTFVLEDARAGRVWQATGALQLRQTDDRAEVTASLNLPGEEGRGGAVDLEFVSSKASPEASISARFADLQPSDIAEQSAALAWLTAVDAAVSGDLSVRIDEGGAFTTISGGLSLAEGALRPTAESEPVRFDAAALRFALDPATERIAISEMIIDSTELRLQTTGHVTLTADDGDAPRSFLGQFRVTELLIDPAGQFAEPVRFDSGVVDLRFVAEPFRVDLGQILVQRGDQSIMAYGGVSAGPSGWQATLDARISDLGHQQLMDHWPFELAPRVRAWLSENLIRAQVSNIAARLRLSDGARPQLSLSYDFIDAELRAMPTLPPVTGARGHASIHAQAFALVVDAGHVEPPTGGPINVAGSVFRVADTSERPARGHLALQAESTITAALSLLDQPPFGYMSKAGQEVDLADGRARIRADLAMPLVRPLTPDQVQVSATGRLRAVSSDRLVPGRQLNAEGLSVALADHRLEIGGEGMLDGVPFRATWSRGTRPDDAGQSRVLGTVELSDTAARTFGLTLPSGSISGRATGRIALDLERDRPPRFSLTSDLVGLDLRFAPLGWSKPASTGGVLEVSGQLGPSPAVDRLSLQAPGLSTSGTVSLTAAGELERARFPRVQLGGWLDAEVELTGRGRGAAPGVAVLGSTADLRRADFARSRASAPSGSGAAGRGQDLTIALDRLVISEGIALTGFRGRFSQQEGMAGSFSGRVNGEAPVSGVVAPAAGGRSAFRLRAEDAGAVFRAAGVFGKAHGGALDMVLSPRGGAGEYDGRMQVRDTRVRQAPVLADLLGAISVIGLLEQLNGQGLVFSDLEADFRLTPQTIEVISASATGNSLGISLTGVYGLRSKVMEMQGVISPIYMLNAIGGIFSPRRGEGLIGVTYRLSGPADQPQIQINPFSILAPGGLREVFRRTPPRLTQ